MSVHYRTTLILPIYVYSVISDKFQPVIGHYLVYRDGQCFINYQSMTYCKINNTLSQLNIHYYTDSHFHLY
jgi:hypothetical protein